MAAKKIKRRWKLHYKGPIDEFDPRSSLIFWRGKSALEKFIEVQKLIAQAQSIRGEGDKDGSELLRTTAVLKRF